MSGVDLMVPTGMLVQQALKAIKLTQYGSNSIDTIRMSGDRMVDIIYKDGFISEVNIEGMSGIEMLRAIINKV